MYIHHLSGKRVETSVTLERIVKGNVSRIIIYSYYNIKKINLRKLANLTKEVVDCLFICPHGWDRPEYFSENRKLMLRLHKYIEKKINNEQEFNQHVVLTKISTILNRLNNKICNKKQLELLKIWIAKEQKFNINLEQWPSNKLGMPHQCKYNLN